MKSLIAYFNLRLGAGRSIGHTELLSIWGRAAGTQDIALRRTRIGAYDADKACVYTLSGPRELEAINLIEDRLRQMLPNLLGGPAIKLTRLV